MKPLCADCGTEHQPCDHPADQWPENRRRVGEDQIERLKRENSAQRLLLAANDAIARVLSSHALIHLSDYERTTINAAFIQISKVYGFSVDAELAAETELLNLIEKGTIHE